jgi:hypothetical protein
LLDDCVESSPKKWKETLAATGWNTRSSDQILWLLLIGRQVKLTRWRGGTPASALSIAGFIHHPERGKKDEKRPWTHPHHHPIISKWSYNQNKKNTSNKFKSI